MKRRCFALILATLMVVMLAGCGDNGADDDRINIKIGTVTSENAPVSQALMRMKEEI